jgi:hypothetical protein
MESSQIALESSWRCKEEVEVQKEQLGFQGVRSPHCIPYNPEVGYVWAGVRTCPVGRICSGKGLDMSGEFRHSGFQKIRKPLEYLINDGFGV